MDELRNGVKAFLGTWPEVASIEDEGDDKLVVVTKHEDRFEVVFEA